MSYRIEGKDIVLSGHEQGIADTPYAGIADMRNVEIVGIPGEASVGYEGTPAAQPVALNAVAYTADDTTDRITIPSTTGLYEGTAFSLSVPLDVPNLNITLTGNTASILSSSVSNFYPSRFVASGGGVGTDAVITFNFITQPNNTDGGNFTVNGDNAAFQFVNTLGAVGGQVLIGATLQDTVDNFLHLLQNPSVTNAQHIGWSGDALTIMGYFTATQPALSSIYYVANIVGNTFQVKGSPAASVVLDILSDTSGTLTTYTYGNQRGLSTVYGAPVSYFVEKDGSLGGSNAIILTDASNYVWAILPAAQGNLPANSLIFLGNTGGIGADSVSGTGVAIWQSYFILLGPTSADAASVSAVWSGDTGVAWDYDWNTDIVTGGVGNRISIVVSSEDGNLYFTSAPGVGSIIEQPGETFDSTDADTYAITDEAIGIPSNDASTCLAELGSTLLIGGRGSFMYVWDKLSLGYNTLINIPDSYTTNIVATSQNAYVFAGVRGRIYITNGSGIDLFKKVSDYITGTINPYFQWLDASFGRNQLYFSFQAKSNADAVLTTVAGCWAIDLESNALRLQTKTTNSTYAGSTRMVTEMPAASLSDNPTGSAMTIGWWVDTTYVVDVSSGSPYDTYESIIEYDMIPVGTYLDPFTPSQVEWKTSVPLVAGEGVKLLYRTNLSEAFTQIGESTTAGALSDMFQTNFEKAQWVQLRQETKSTVTTPSFVRSTEIRIRDWPSGKNNRN